MNKPTPARLADGRELLYFHDAGAPGTSGHPFPDKRDLPARPPLAEMRLYPMLRQWVAFAAHRQTRHSSAAGR
ncbi:MULTISPECIES: hypothetical protein [unclassified Arthrobacter]|uniref:hypothetical protein n=1 Tax=unclassified Arthrobacter TaxID=235627 RepID=UPI0033975ED0